ncbi:hypothetical protein GGR53DRAFT_518157 [Hypoxylon sp. FL1150]|nr:hypothetical protein GGR53DRAFT_518157 [Hypoxylon sp. FL1150]
MSLVSFPEPTSTSYEPRESQAPATHPAKKSGGTASASRKRKAETSLDEEIAAHKGNLDDVVSTDEFEDEQLPTCQAVRDRINKMLDAGIMNKSEFAKAMGNSTVYYNAWAWFRQREVAGLKMPDVKRRQIEEDKACGPSSGGGTASKATATAPLPDITWIYLAGEEEDEVLVYDTCDDVRRKINAHLKTPGVTQAKFCRDLYAQLREPKVKGISPKQLANFRGQKGPRTGAESTVFYTAYVHFEKLRVARGKPTTKHREDMELIWPRGFDRTADHRTA